MEARSRSGFSCLRGAGLSVLAVAALVTAGCGENSDVPDQPSAESQGINPNAAPAGPAASAPAAPGGQEAVPGPSSAAAAEMPTPIPVRP